MVDLGEVDNPLRQGVDDEWPPVVIGDLWTPPLLPILMHGGPALPAGFLLGFSCHVVLIMSNSPCFKTDSPSKFVRVKIPIVITCNYQISLRIDNLNCGAGQRYLG